MDIVTKWQNLEENNLLKKTDEVYMGFVSIHGSPLTLCCNPLHQWNHQKDGDTQLEILLTQIEATATEKACVLVPLCPVMTWWSLQAWPVQLSWAICKLHTVIVPSALTEQLGTWESMRRHRGKCKWEEDTLLSTPPPYHGITHS